MNDTKGMNAAVSHDELHSSKQLFNIIAESEMYDHRMIMREMIRSRSRG